MNCHYSCATCSAAIYMHKCLTCPTTRQLLTNTCPCSSGYYEAQTKYCYPPQQASLLMQLVLPIADALFYTNIALFWLYIIILFCRVNSPKIRIIINFSQGFALLLSYPYLFDKLSYAFLQTLLPYNFSYFNSIFSCNSDICLLFSYVWEPLLVLPCILGCFFISYFLMSVCYKNSLSQGIGFGSYFRESLFFVVFCFFDVTALKFGENFGKAVKLSSWAWIFVGVFVTALIVIIWKLFRILNSQEQTKVIYRSKYSWAYGYDENYHLHYIDFLYSQARHKPLPPQHPSPSPSFLHPENPPQLPSNSPQKIKLFIPHSNLYICQLSYKFLLGLTTILLYELNPVFLIYSLIMLLLIFVIWLGTFMYYDKLNLLLYFFMAVGFMVYASLFWMVFFWLLAMIVAFFVVAAIGACFAVLFFVNSRIKDKVISKMFVGYADKRRITEAEELSQQEMHIKNHYEQKEDKQKPHSSILNQQPATKTKLQPFVGNLTRKGPLTLNKQQTQQISNTQKVSISQTQDLLRTYQPTQVQQKPKLKGKKQIFVDKIRQNSNQNQGEFFTNDNVIKHSTYQSKLKQIEAKIIAKNRTKNIFEDLMQDKLDATVKQDDRQDKLNGDQDGEDKLFDRKSSKDRLKNNEENKQSMNKQSMNMSMSIVVQKNAMQRGRTTSKSLNEGIQKNKKRLTQDQDFLSNVLEQGQEQQNIFQQPKQKSLKNNI